MKEIPLGNSELVALVDDEDYERVVQFNWTLLPPREERYTPYAYRRAWIKEKHRSGPTILMHRFLLDFPPASVDHKDGNGLNNQRDNLRPATQSFNNANAAKRQIGTSRFKGVFWHKKHQKWFASCAADYIGIFDDEIEAALAYDAAARLKWGEFSKQNFA